MKISNVRSRGRVFFSSFFFISARRFHNFSFPSLESALTTDSADKSQVNKQNSCPAVGCKTAAIALPVKTCQIPLRRQLERQMRFTRHILVKCRLIGHSYTCKSTNPRFCSFHLLPSQFASIQSHLHKAIISLSFSTPTSIAAESESNIVERAPLQISATQHPISQLAAFADSFRSGKCQPPLEKMLKGPVAEMHSPPSRCSRSI